MLSAWEVGNRPTGPGQGLWLESLVQSKLIDYWELQDDPEHLRTIAHRLLYDDQQAGRLLGLYQNLLTATVVPANDSREQIELLSGLAVKQQGRLQVINRIYRAVFNTNWVEQQLADLRPYAAALNAWRQLKLSGSIPVIERASPDGKFLASGSRDKTIRFWHSVHGVSPERNRTAAPALGAWIKTLKGHQQDVIAVRFSPNGQYLGSAGWNGEILLWQADGSPIRSIANLSADVNDLTFSPDGQMLASANGDHTIKFWSLEGQLIRTLAGHRAHVISVAFSPDGQRLASASQDRSVKLWQSDGTLLASLNAHTNTVPGFAFSPDGQLVASTSWDKTVILWDLNRVVNLDQVFKFGCAWVKDYLQTQPQGRDRDLCQVTD